MSFFVRLSEQAPYVVIAFGVALAALVLVAGFEWLARRREDGPVRRVVRADDAPAVAMPVQFAEADHERAVAEHSAAVDAILHKPRAPKRVNRHKAKARRHK